MNVSFALASDDTTIPPTQEDWFIANVADPNYFLRPGGKVTGGHTGLFFNVPYEEVVDFYASLAHDPTKWKTVDTVRASQSVTDMGNRYGTVAAMATSGLRVVTV